ncbi:MAG: hypothetical protein KDD51_11085 [Bdellovibrionales bacterium]|nr:hypothetical protein [Bdellovibrionales bacterium]
MDTRPKIYASWDTAIFFVITAVGFVFSLQRVVSPQQQAVASPAELERPHLGDVVDLGCVDEHAQLKPVANSSGTIRLKGRVCGKRKTSPVLEDIAVRNRTRSEATTVFQSVRYSFTTDGLQLEKGRNVIEVSWRQWGQPDVESVSLEVFRK